MITRLFVEHTRSGASSSNPLKVPKKTATEYHDPHHNNMAATASMVGNQHQHQKQQQQQFGSLSPPNGERLSASSSSLSNTDSDSLRSILTGHSEKPSPAASQDRKHRSSRNREQQQALTKANGSDMASSASISNNNNNNAIGAATKSPILIKYNYYDHNGSRQEQTNHDMNYFCNNQQPPNNSAKVQRQLSPTFRQSLDQIVRNSQLQMQAQKQQQQALTATGGDGGEKQVQARANNVNSSPSSSSLSPPSSPEFNQPVVHHFARRYKLSLYEQRCLRCNKTVYQMDKVGPLKDFTFYHQNCFKCRECGTKLTLKTYFNNQQSSGDQEVYCHRHCPKTGPGKLDNQSVGIRAALNVPKVFDVNAAAHLAPNGGMTQQPSNQDSQGPPGANSHQQQQQLQHQLLLGGQMSPGARHSPTFVGQPTYVDSRALHIRHAVQQTRLQSIYKSSQVDKKISQFLNKRLEFLEPKQKMLEMRHREEEDALFKAFELKWRQAESSISEQIRQEWQVELDKLLEKYKRQLSSISASASSQHSAVGEQSFNHSGDNHKLEHQIRAGQIGPRDDLQLVKLMMRQQQQAAKKGPLPSGCPQVASSNNNNNSDSKTCIDEQQQVSKQQMIEFERLNLEKTMTIKLDRKKETLKRKLKEFERQATAELVEKQSREMLSLISMKLDEYKEEQKRKIGSDLEQFEAIELLANQLDSSLQLAAARDGSSNGATKGSNGMRTGSSSSNNNNQQWSSSSQAHLSSDDRNHMEDLVASAAGHARQPVVSAGSERQLEAPAPKRPLVSKMELYNNEEPDEVFKDIDELAINVAREDQQTFTDLVHHLTRNCLTDIEKVRAIFRWITVKNLNTMQFDSSVKPDTPLGLLRGIKNGSESYHVLFKRLCSYAGLHCVVIKGYSKSAGYQPGVKFDGNRFRNSWNAVYVAGAWRFVQCNWGARHLVSVAVMQDKNQPTGSSNGAKADTVAVGGGSSVDPVAARAHAVQAINAGRSHHHHQNNHHASPIATAAVSAMPNHGRRGQVMHHQQQQQLVVVGAHVIANSLASANFIGSPHAATASAQVEPSASTASSAVGGRHHLHPHLHHHHHQQHSSSTDAPAASVELQAPASRANGRRSSPRGSSAYSSPISSASSPSSSCLSYSPPTTKTNGNSNSQQVAAASTGGAKSSPSSNDSLRYEYDDHYFLTDPDEFVYEFYPLSPEWQLIKSRPITLADFEQLPFVRSLFFKYGLYFPQQNIRSVLYTDSSGATTIKIGMPTHMIPSLIFHYNLKYYDSDSEHYEGTSLKRFVMQSVESGTNEGNANGSTGNSQGVLLANIVSFRVHLPENGAYILDIFANSTTPTQYITGEPMKFKSVCKFKIVAKNLKTVMIPLPDCASGEYGPMKATRLFGLIPITHESGLIAVQSDKRFLEIQFRMTRPLSDFMASLHKNGYDERQLSKSIKILIHGDIVSVAVEFAEFGQYGLDIYTRDQIMSNQQQQNSNGKSKSSSSETKSNHSAEHQKQLLTHCCKYLINVRSSTNL